MREVPEVRLQVVLQVVDECQHDAFVRVTRRGLENELEGRCLPSTGTGDNKLLGTLGIHDCIDCSLQFSLFWSEFGFAGQVSSP
jgi:hypothetical protein